MKSSYNRIVEIFTKLKSQKMKEVGRLTSKDFTKNILLTNKLIFLDKLNLIIIIYVDLLIIKLHF